MKLILSKLTVFKGYLLLEHKPFSHTGLCINILLLQSFLLTVPVFENLGEIKKISRAPKASGR